MWQITEMYYKHQISPMDISGPYDVDPLKVHFEELKQK